ncbi:SMC-Scp complex subunit ScpB [Candidatus Falkowbacteria bacterium]|nr:SMC-Scp complex subunit ScpB [Candidatus Falkowbacteria bacterium]
MINKKNQIESLLFISHKPLGLGELAKLVSADKKEVVENLAELENEYGRKAGGIQLLKIDDKYQLGTSGDSSEVVGKFIRNEMTGELTRPSLETLTIITYRGPISKAELELIRGVNCSLILRNLLMRGLVESKEDKNKGNTFYTITFDFLKYLGLGKIEDLPDYEKLNRNNNLDKLLQGVSDNKAKTN